MISFPFWLIYKAHSILERVIHSTLTTLIYLCVALTIGHFFGWIERYIWWCLEKEACKALNDGLITIGSFTIDWSEILQGKITLHASNVVLHTKERDAWQWESPLVARVGRATVECNAPITIFHFLVFRRELPIEVYTLKASDIQVFLERRDQTFNVYLFDKSAMLPQPPPPRPEVSKNISAKSDDTADNNNNNNNNENNALTENNHKNNNNNNNSDVLDTSSISVWTANSSSSVGNDDNDHKNKAKLLVSEMLSAVETLGRAAQQGSLQSTIRQQGLELADKLIMATNKNGNKQQLHESVQVMKHVGKVAVESFNQVAPKQLLPDRKPGRTPKPVYGRVGRIKIEGLRIFTKDSWIHMGEEEGSGAGAGGGAGLWNKPIFIETMVVRASELCPPMSLKDEDGMPAVYQTLDKVIEVVWKRLLAEMAKSNGGKLFQTAMGEVLSFMKPTTTTTPTTTSTTATTSTTTTNTTTAATTNASTSSATTTTATAVAASTTTSSKKVLREVRV
jgi:hypothetical protein